MPGPLGYPDWQRQTNWDGPLLFSNTAQAVAPVFITNIFDVSRFAYLGGYNGSSVSQCLLTITWFADKAGAVAVGNRIFTLTSAIPVQGKFRLPNMGPYVQLRWDRFGGVSDTISAQIFGTNRFHPLEFVPVTSPLVNQQNTAIAASANNTYSPSDYYAGPAHVWNTCAQSITVSILSLESDGAYHYVDQGTGTGGGAFTFNTIIPPGGWQVIVTNNSGVATTHYTVVTPSQTGST